MKLEQQVVSLELAKKLKELGMKQESLFGYVVSRNTGELGSLEYDRCCGLCSASYYGNREGWISAFTVAELGDILKKGFSTKSWSDIDHTIWYEGTDYGNQDGNTEADARAKMLIYLLENKLITL